MGEMADEYIDRMLLWEDERIDQIEGELSRDRWIDNEGNLHDISSMSDSYVINALGVARRTESRECYIPRLEKELELRTQRMFDEVEVEHG